jgi:hypothetical protein
MMDFSVGISVSNQGFGPAVVVIFLLFASTVKSHADVGTAIISQPQKTNACGLLAYRQVSELMKVHVSPGVRDDTGALHGTTYEGSYSSTCVWRTAGNRGADDPGHPLAGASFAILTVITWPPDSDGPTKFLQSFRDAAQSHIITTTPLPLQIGDEAIWWGDGIAARKGNISFGISVHLPKGRIKERSMEEDLAGKIVARLRSSS